MTKFYSLSLLLLLCISSCSKKTPMSDMPDTSMPQDSMEVEVDTTPSPTIVEIARFPNEINECSGMIKTEDRIISMNDGSSHTLLQEINPTTAEIVSVIHVNDIANVDWEAIQYENGKIYIADTGNNEGDRESLNLYTIPYQTGSEFICMDTINFIWPDQTDFTTSNFHPFDCESLLIEGNTAIFFSKNRSDLKTNVYRLDLTTENIIKGESINVGGLTTDIAKDPSGDLILLSYLTFNGSSFINKISILEKLDGAYHLKRNIAIPQTTQIEAIVHLEDHKYLLGAESETDEGGYLYSLDLSAFY